jgi:hypothetical protein
MCHGPACWWLPQVQPPIRRLAAPAAAAGASSSRRRLAPLPPHHPQQQQQQYPTRRAALRLKSKQRRRGSSRGNGSNRSSSSSSSSSSRCHAAAVRRSQRGRAAHQRTPLLLRMRWPAWTQVRGGLGGGEGREGKLRGMTVKGGQGGDVQLHLGWLGARGAIQPDLTHCTCTGVGAADVGNAGWRT